MAFNPFHAFQKNKKFWMAAVLLITMITVIFCTGGGDMQDRLMSMFRKRGTTLITIGSYRLSRQDLDQMRADRNMINEFMMKCARITADNLAKTYDDAVKKTPPGDAGKAKEQQAQLNQILAFQNNLIHRLRHPRFFEGGVMVDDLIEFKTWQTQADRLGVKISDDDLDAIVQMQFFSNRSERFISPREMQEAQMMARGSKEVTDVIFRRALMDEYRVRIAKLAIIKMQTAHYFQNSQFPLDDPNLPDQQRAHVTLAQIWKVFQEKRAEMDVTLVPIHVDDFTKEVYAQKPPTEAELESFYQKYKTEKYDPASPLPSFESPMKVKVEYIMADPTSARYLDAARAKLVVQGALPQLALLGSPLQSATMAAARAGAFAAGQQNVVYDVLEGMSQPKAYELYRTADLGADQFIWPMAAYFAQREPRAIASFIGNASAEIGNPGLPAWAGFLGEASVPRQPGNAGHKAEIDAGLAIEVKRRTVPYASIAAAGAIGQPAGMAAVAISALKLRPTNMTNFQSEPLLLPMPVIEHQLAEVVENRTAEQRASRNLLAVKKLLDKSTNPQAVKRVINEAVPKYDLTHVVTKGYYDRYDIDKAPELQPLRDAYEKYFTQVNWFEKRDVTPERLLKDTDFYKLFFDNESFTTTGKYQVRPWPPDVQPNQLQVRTMPGANPNMPNISVDVLADVQRAMQQQDGGQAKRFSLLDKAQKPILFWRTDDKPAEIPQTLKAAGDKVLNAWKISKARELKALPTAKKIADELLLAHGDYTSEVLRKARLEAHDRPLVEIKHLAPLVPNEVGEKFRGGHREYITYRLRKDAVPLPDPDMVPDMLTLYDPSKPIAIKSHRKEGMPAFTKTLNDFNEALFDKAKKEDKKGVFVQVLTNLPQTIYYVAVVNRPPTAKPEDFSDAVQWASESPFRSVDLFVTRAQVLLAKDFHARLLKQIQSEVVFRDNMEAKDRDEFDKSADSGR
jgi:hypothetical protein